MTYLCTRYKNIGKMDSTYITEYGYNGPVSQPTSESVSLSVLGRQTDVSQPVSPSIYP